MHDCCSRVKITATEHVSGGLCLSQDEQSNRGSIERVSENQSKSRTEASQCGKIKDELKKTTSPL